MLRIIVTERRLSYAITELWAKISSVFSRQGHTHTTDEVTMVDDQNELLTQKLEELEDLAAAGIVL